MSTVAVIVGLSIAGAAAYLVTSRILHEQVDDSLRSSPGAIGGSNRGRSPSPPDPDGLCEAIRSAENPSPSLFNVALVRPDGSVCQSSDSSAIVITEADLAAATQTGGPTLRDGELEDGHAARLAISRDSDGNTVIAARDTQSIVNVLNTLKLTLLGVTVLGALLALALSRWTSGAGLRPVTRFTRVAEQIAATGDLEHQVASDPPPASRRGDELDRLAHAFDTMTRVLADAQVRQRRLVADAGHELRTPLSSLRNNISLLKRSRELDRALPAGEEDRLLGDLSSQVAELTALVDDLASLASTENEPPVMRTIRFDQCVERAVQRAKNRSSGHAISARLEPWMVDGDPAGLERAAVNLIDNAIKFSPPDSEIHVELTDGRLTVADRGEGISEEETARAFERFWRSSRARSLPGSGLGLSIVDDVARQHDGWAQLSARPGGGVVATMFVPGDETR